MASEEASNSTSPAPSDSSDSSDLSVEVPEALAFGREKRATAGNKLRALLDAEFQEEEIFKEDEDDEEFERQKSDEGEEYISESESSGDEDQQDEEEGERALIAEQKSAAKKSREKKRKATETFAKPVPKRKPPPRKEELAPVKSSKPASTTSSLSNRRILFDPSLLAARRSSRALTVQTTNETQSRIISAAARRATQPVVPRREQTPPLTQEERLAQAKITEEENKMSLKRIVEAEEERGRKRREKLEALRRRRFDEPILRFISKRGSLIEEIPDEGEYEIVVDDVETGVTKEEAGQSIKQEPLESEHLRETTKEVADNLGEKTDGKEPSGVEGDKIAMDGLPTGQTQIDQESKESAAQPVIAREFSETAKSQQPLSANDTSASLLDEQMDVDHVELSAETIIQPDMGTKSTIIPNATALVDPKTTAHANSTESESAKTAEETTPLGIDPTPQETTTENIASSGFEETQPTTQPSSTNLQPSPQRPPVPPRTPPPYHEAHFTSNTLTYIPLPTQPSLPPTARETFFPNLPLIPPAKPKPSAKCPITGLPARYKDPLSGVGYYDIHAFKILREVGRTGGRYIWCSEGGWFVGEMGWGGRGAKGVPEGWNGLASERKVVGT